jgi:hypothetical protein
MLHSDDYISLFVSYFDIPVSLGNLFHRQAPARLSLFWLVF